MRITMLSTLVLVQVLSCITDGSAETLRCTTREDRVFDQLITTCTDGSKAITRYERAFDRWVTTITRSGEAGRAVPSMPAPKRGTSR